MITLAENLKKLRHGRDLTQEDLAEFIGVSAQSISKWERGDNLPDITILPAIANFFEVTTDDLLGMNAIRDEKRIGEMNATVDAMYNDPTIPEDEKWERHIALYRDLARDMPNNYAVQASYAYVMANDASNLPRVREAAHILERVLEHCTDAQIRGEATNSLIYACENLGDLDAAQRWAETLPDAGVSRERAIAGVASARAMKVLGAYSLNSGEVDAVPPSISKEDAETLLAPIGESLKIFALQTSAALNMLAECRRRFGLADEEEYIDLLKRQVPLHELVLADDEQMRKKVTESYENAVANAHTLYGGK
ncbi:MAG: helix-turn-helix domain-containing protein [Oscillospiraceae bacterium]|jgi:transcriptional regulator with XRE-family HTH domain|nr:helix-turn-helix domain-containing protein [Oscillospiraceae bacterium]